MDKSPLALLVLILAIACTQPSGHALPAGGLSQAQFIAVMTDLSLAEPADRPAILKRHRTTDAGIRAAVEALSAHPLLLSETLDTIQNNIERARMLKPANTID
jgi:hypothetical protein